MNFRILLVLLCLFAVIGCKKETKPEFGNANYEVLFISQNMNDDYDSDFYLYKMDFDGSNVIKISDSAVFYSKPILSNNFNEIAYSTEYYMQNPKNELFILDTRNQTHKSIDKTNGRFNSNSISWAIDDSFIVYSRKETVTSNKYSSIFIYNFINDTLKQLTSFGDCFDSQISPDGKSISFLNIFDLYTMNLDGSNKKLISSGNVQYYDWNHKNNKIVYAVFDENKKYHIYKMEDDGSSIEYLAEGTNPRCTPDGSKIIYFKPILDTSNSEIWIMNQDGKNKKILVQSNNFRNQISISPDSRYVLLMVYTCGLSCTEIAMVDIETSQMRMLSNGRTSDKFPSFIGKN